MLMSTLSAPMPVETLPTLPAPQGTLQLVFYYIEIFEIKGQFLTCICICFVAFLKKEDADEESLIWYVQYHCQQSLK